MKAFIDAASIEEDRRIGLIGAAAIKETKPVAFIVEADPPEKAERYIRKLLERFPQLCVLQRLPGPVPTVVTISITRRSDLN